MSASSSSSRSAEERSVTQGKIIKGIAGFYYVHTAQHEVYECKAKGIFRKEKIKPLVGDDVKLELLNREEKTGNITEILTRKNELLRPAVANIDQALVIFAAASPKPNFQLLDKLLISMEYQQIAVVLCFNKCDIASVEEQKEIAARYDKCGSQLLFTSAKQKQGKEELLRLLADKTTAVAGPSGVGKSSIINMLQPNVEMETGTISEKIERGRHTTRHSQLIHIQDGTYIMDTPGFSSLYVESIPAEELKEYFAEFAPYEGTCRFLGCSHTHEPGCGVKEALKQGKLHPGRYENYVSMYHELKEIKRY